MSGESKESFESFSPAQAREEIKNSFLRRRKLQKLREISKKMRTSLKIAKFKKKMREIPNYRKLRNFAIFSGGAHFENS